MTKFTVILQIAVLLIMTSRSSSQTEDQKFEALTGNYIEEFLRANPEWATSLGDHRYDHRLNDYSPTGVERNLELNKTALQRLAEINVKQLSLTNGIDYKILRSNIESMIFQLETLREHEWNPLVYNLGGAIYALVAREFAPLKDRLVNAKERLKAIPSVIEQAKANLKNPPQIHTETAISQNKGTIGLIRDELNRLLEQVPELKDEFVPIQAEAGAALEECGRWLQEDLLPRSRGNFRLGEEKFRIKLRHTLESDLTKEEILRRAQADLKMTHQAMANTALSLHKRYFPQEADPNSLGDKKAVIKAVLDKLAESHPTNDTIVDLAKEYTRSITEFVRSNDLVTVSDEPVKIIVMPEFERGVAVAYCDAPGPLEERGETFYAIAPTPEDWSQDRRDSFFREYNNLMVQDLTIHEAMPGHYLQLSHAKTFEAPTRVRAIFASGTFVEGWATYAEQFMVEKGYGGPEVKMQQLKMRLRMIINAIIDQKIHTEEMTQEEAVALMMNEGFQEEGEAAGKWRRACLTSTQLSTYYVGNIELNDIRKAVQASMGSATDLKAMHDKMISFGSPAPKYVKELMGL